jgi:hypothetical protein
MQALHPHKETGLSACQELYEDHPHIMQMSMSTQGQMRAT